MHSTRFSYSGVFWGLGFRVFHTVATTTPWPVGGEKNLQRITLLHVDFIKGKREVTNHL